MATGMTEVDGTPPFKKRKSIQNADTHATPSPSARTWVQTFNRLTAPFFGVPAFTSPPAPPIKQEKVTPQNPAGYKHVFGVASVKAPDFTFAPPTDRKKLFQNTLQAQQVPSKQLTPLSKSAPDGDTQTDAGVARSASAKLRKICAFFSKQAPAPSPAAATLPTSVLSIQPAHPATPTQNVPAQPAPAARPVPTARDGPTRGITVQTSGGQMQFRNGQTGVVTTIATAGMQTLQHAAATVPWRAPPPSHISNPSTVVAQPQVVPGAKRTHVETMSVVPTQRLNPRRASRQIASAVPRLARLSLDDPTFLHAVQVVQGFTDYVFKSHEYIREALYSPRMPISIGARISLQGNQRLAMLGDSLLKLAVLEEWEGRVQSCYETEKEGSRLWCNATLARIGRNNGLDYLLTALASGYATGFVTGVVSVATAMEAILGAIWFDCGKDLTVVRKVVRLWFGNALT